MKKDFSDLFKLVETAIKYPELMPEKLAVISLSQDKLNELLTPARRKLILAIKTNSPKTVTELAGFVGRKQEAVSLDLKVLANYGIVSFEAKGRVKMPRLDKEAVLIPLTA